MDEQAKMFDIGVRAVAQWIRLRLPSYRPGYKSQAHNTLKFVYEICSRFKGRSNDQMSGSHFIFAKLPLPQCDQKKIAKCL